MTTKCVFTSILVALLSLGAAAASFDRSVRTADDREPAIPHPEQEKAVAAKLAALQAKTGKTELFNLAEDPGEKTNVADQHPDIVRDLEARLMAYAKQQKPSLWIKAQPEFVGEQGKTIFDPDFVIDDGGLPHEKSALPQK